MNEKMRETVNKPVDGMGKVGKLEVSGSGEKEILASGELEGIPTTRKFRVVRLEGKRQDSRQIDFYNLEMVISVGYRVNSRRGVLFRRWATRVLTEFLLKGSVRDQRISKLEKRMTEAERSINTIVYTLTPALPSASRSGFIRNNDFD